MLIILYTHKPITGLIPRQVVSPANIWDGALCDNSYCLHCIPLGNGITHIVSSYEFHVFCVSSLSSSCFRWLPACSRWFQLVPDGSSSFQMVPCFSMYACDTVDHSILLSKLCHYGICGFWNKLLESYLAVCKQFVSINGFASCIPNNICDVP